MTGPLGIELILFPSISVLSPVSVSALDSFVGNIGLGLAIACYVDCKTGLTGRIFFMVVKSASC